MSVVSKKSEFIERVRKMKSPIISEYVDMGYANLSFYVEDREDFSNKFHTNGVWWRWRGRNPEKLEDYYSREEKFKQKIERWFEIALTKK